MRHIVLDTNCLLQSLPSKSPYHQIWNDILHGKISLCVNTEIYFNVLKQLPWPKISIVNIKEFLNTL